jgi:hypothetical protein
MMFFIHFREKKDITKVYAYSNLSMTQNLKYSHGHGERCANRKTKIFF